MAALTRLRPVFKFKKERLYPYFLNYINNSSNKTNLDKRNSSSSSDDEHRIQAHSVDGNIRPATDELDIILKNRKEDMPDFDLPNPYEKEKKQCILCKYKIEVNYKNVKLLSQFVSQFTGQVYGKHITGLCSKQQKRVEKAIQLSQGAGFMPYEYKDLQYLKDPKLFDYTNVSKKLN